MQGLAAMAGALMRMAALGNRRSACLLGGAAILWFAANALAANAEGEFCVGSAVVDITPPVGYRMSGYFSERLSTGTHDPLFAKAVYFQQGETRAAWVFCDLIGIDRQVSRAARAEAERTLEIPAANIVISATHSHTGPLYAGALRKHFHDQKIAQHGTDPYEAVDYPAELTQLLVEAIAAAKENAVEAELGVGSAEVLGLSFNRRFHMKDGTVRFNPGRRNPDIVRVAGPIDPEAGLVLFRNAIDEAPLALLTVFALHLDTVGGTEYSADYPLYLQEAVHKTFGVETVSLFGAGTCGDINHIDVAAESQLGGREGCKSIGTRLAAAVLPKAEKLASKEPQLAMRSKIIEPPLQKFSDDEIAAAHKNLFLIGSRELSFLEQVQAYKIAACGLIGGDKLPMEVQALRLSGDTALVALPGEVFVDLGLEIKRRSPFKHTFVVELSNDAPGYIPTRKAFAEGSYETVNSRVQPGGGEAMVEAAVELLKELAPR